MTAGAQRVVEHLNAALHELFDRHPDLHLLGEDIADPYGGAFRATKGLSTAYPDRVHSTPISENGIIGVAGGLALAGDRVIVEVMFGDFITLGFDQIVNFATKSVTMYGRRKQMKLVVRCPVGGHRAYGPTHSQSLQKHFIGVPNLALYELSAFHDPRRILEQALASGEPAIIFEHKTLYGQRMRPPGQVHDGSRVDYLDPARNWVHIRPAAEPPPGAPALVVLAPGGSAGGALDAARALITEHGVRVDILVPARLYPLDLDPVLDLVGQADGVCVVEESTEGGTWGTEVARHLHERLWGVLRRPVRLLSSADRIIPAAPHLERQVLVGTDDIRAALVELLPTAAPDRKPVAGQSAAAVPLRPVTVPKLNNNDDSYVLVAWLADDGATVTRDDSIAEIETSKAVEEILAGHDGILRHAASEGTECRPGENIGQVLDPADPAPLPAAPLSAGIPDTMAVAPAADAEVVELDRGQQQVARVVSAAHREIPAAFVVRRVRLDAVTELQRTRDDRDADPVGLLELTVKLVAEQRTAFPLCFATPVDERLARLSTGAHVGVTMDAGNGLYIPVARDADRRPLAELADELSDFRMRALRGTFTEQQLTGATIAVSWNHSPDVVLVRPIIPAGVCCAVSVGGPLPEVRLDADGTPVPGQFVHIGLAHDHRLVNGNTAIAFLDAMAAALEDNAVLDKLSGD